MKAIWMDEVVAESNETVMLEGNHYFPINDVKMQFMIKSETNSICPWKGTASYYSLRVKGEENLDAAWYYKEPKDAANQIEDRIAFWKGVRISE